MKKYLIILLLISGLFLISACQDGNGDPNDDDPNDITITTPFSNEENLLGFSVISAVKMLSGMNGITLSTPMNPLTRMDSPLSDFEILDEIEELERYLEFINTFMGSGNGFETIIIDNESGTYAHTMIINTTDITGDVLSYTFHFNETIEYDDEDDLSSYESTIEGIMLIDGLSYNLYGEREVEAGQESLELTAKLNEDNYVTLMYEIEQDAEELDIEFEYEVYQNGQLIKQTIIEFEQEEDDVKMSLFFLEGTLEYEYDFEIEVDDDEITIEVEYTFVDDGVTIEEGSIEITVWFDYEADAFKISYEIEIDGADTIYIERTYKSDEESQTNNAI